MPPATRASGGSGLLPAPPHPQGAPAWQPCWGRTRRRQRRSFRRLRPRRYDSERPSTKGSYGANASYEHEWRISTWAFNLPGTFPHSAFRQRYGTPFDEGLLALVRGAGLLQLLELIKRQFEQALRARGAAAAAAVGAATLSQLFLTVQPHKQRMNDELDSYMQSHYDPAAARLSFTSSAEAPRGAGPRPDSSLAQRRSPSRRPRLRLWLPRLGCAWAGGWWSGWVGPRRLLAQRQPAPAYPRICQCTAYALQVLTINIHLSPLDYCGCLPSENGLVLHDLDLTVAHLL